ncbi:hypothetical protein RKD23_003175 [Streptomyces sp. SAI-170]|uniref:hypothetical protein n=1 Tax=Streptomyces sp. SAI-170 TaxID=3377729 RepID=UPI003C7AB2DB
MSSRPLKAAVGLAAAGVLTLAAAPAQAADPNPFAWAQLTPTYTATGQYAYEPLAQASGYQRMNTCVPHLGYHYVNPEFIGSVDPAEPAVLVYEDGPRNTRRLVAVEWAVMDTGQETPELFGQKFDEGQHPGYFTLHAWIYKSNPDGLFKGPNPTVVCATAP